MSEYTDYSLVVHPLNHGGVAKNDTTLAILQDLIAESRAWLAGDHPEPLVWMLNRAEARLKELGDSE